MIPIDPAEITPEHVYLNRRRFMAGLGAIAAAAALAACDRPPGAVAPTPTPDPVPPRAGAETDELGNPLTTYDSVTGYNNYYDFTLSKTGVAQMAQSLRTSPWQVEVGGLVSKPAVFDLPALERFDREERVYRMRCVEGWSMVIPWIGFPLARLLEAVEPTPEARFVRFETVYRPEEMPGQRGGGFPWPYVEGLRLDEAMHPLTLLVTGLYGKSLPPQNGAPLRLAVPWKYGFKDCKSIARIDLVADMPLTFWVEGAPREYGFYANVNPDVPHPRWSQATERRIGETGRRETLPFNGYAAEVESLYAGMDLSEFF
jgi:sulfoxide reductase catalytic subunit YedY